MNPNRDHHHPQHTYSSNSQLQRRARVSENGEFFSNLLTSGLIPSHGTGSATNPTSTALSQHLSDSSCSQHNDKTRRYDYMCEESSTGYPSAADEGNEGPQFGEEAVRTLQGREKEGGQTTSWLPLYHLQRESEAQATAGFMNFDTNR
ncbi:hypothetical protein F5Y06DRAFT_295654 [Hypoxylon sp. FL0890]|nr:hypothetical protein F5Y06DRAFT_295654 [Hypoxylon sp. FL0890]